MIARFDRQIKRLHPLTQRASFALATQRPRSITPTLDGMPVLARYDASDHASLGSPADGGLVATWNDLGSNAAHLTADSGTNRPTYRATGKNSKPVVEFTTNDWLHKNSLSIAAGDIVYFLVGFLDVTVSANFRAWFAYYDSTERYAGKDSASQDYFFRIQENTSGHVDAMVVHAARSTSTKRFYARNGVEQTFAQIAHVAGTTIVHLAMGARINASTQLAIAEKCWISEVVLIDAANCDESQALTISNELKAKWGIS